VNISADHLQSSQFVERLTEMLRARPNVPPALLMLEVLESSALDDMDRVSEIMAECQAMGVTFALDDFGTGYSSLTYLRRLPARELKIDQSFVRDMLDNADDLAIVRGVIGLARAFQREVIAEGVETRAHGDLLLHLGCVLAQGYGISRAMPAQQLPGWVQAWEHNPQWQVGEI
jgi:EAL domain-containing protein (putative c-di-GMP-specific phosphodiesterase class I)